MCAAVEKKAEHPYVYHTPDGNLHTTKCVYADDSTFVITTVSDFASCTGTIIKPQKSYSYATKNNPPLKVRMYLGRETKFQEYELKQITDSQYFRHLGNVQNSRGQVSIKATRMHDGSLHGGALLKLKRNIRALLARNITGAAVIQVLKLVIYKQITYQAQFSQYLPKEFDKLQVYIDSVIRKHAKITSRVGSELIHTHEHMAEWANPEYRTLLMWRNW